MESQKVAWETLELEKHFGIKISSGFMFDPVKTSCQVFILSENEQNFKGYQHDCRNCNNFTCKMRNVPPCEVTVCKDGKENIFLLKDGQSLMEGLIKAWISVQRSLRRKAPMRQVPRTASGRNGSCHRGG